MFNKKMLLMAVAFVGWLSILTHGANMEVREWTNDIEPFGYLWVASVSEPIDWIPGDANNDGRVDVGDLGILAANYGMSIGFPTRETGDFNEDGSIDVGDLAILVSNYGVGTTGVNVPEPVSLLVLAFGGLGLLRWNRRIAV